MCGRYTLLAEANQLAEEFQVGNVVALEPRYNIAPTQNVPVVRLVGIAAPSSMAVVRKAETGGARRLDILRWGLIPSWAKDAKFGYRTINARAETVATQPAFRDAFRKRRCIVPANGFFEWQKSMASGKEVKQPYYIRRRDGRPMGLAGLWDHWEGPDGTIIESFTIITTEANELVLTLHTRMPVILHPEDYDAWLDPGTETEQLQSLLAPCPPEWLIATPVSKQVNNTRNDDPGCIDEVTSSRLLSGSPSRLNPERMSLHGQPAFSTQSMKLSVSDSSMALLGTGPTSPAQISTSESMQMQRGKTNLTSSPKRLKLVLPP
jgi:putative SOS response-associated peptidase YedK